MVLLLILLIETAIAYYFKCPAQAEWKLRANISCILEEKYVCLFHVLEHKYQESCLEPERSSIGSNLVFQPLLNIATCNDERYQPIIFTTNGNSECILLKSKCNEEGQVVYSNGTSSYDGACRCDYTNRYAFVSKPENSCFCKPNEEDCSCFRVKCKVLSADYKCIADGGTKRPPICPELRPEISYTRHGRTAEDVNSEIKRYSYWHHITYIIVIVMTVYIVTVIVVLKLKVFESPKILKQKTIPGASKKIDIGFECSIKSYLPLTSLKWCKQVGEQLNEERDIDVVSLSKRSFEFTCTFEVPTEYDQGTFKCVASNVVGTVESKPVLLYNKLCEVPPDILEQKTIKNESSQKAIGLECTVKSYLPLSYVQWCTKLNDQIHKETDIGVGFSKDRTWTFTFKTPDEYDNETFKCVVSNVVGTKESESVSLYGKLYFDTERQKYIHELLLKGQCGKHHFARVVFIGKQDVGKTSLMRRLLWQKKEDVINTMSTDGIEIEKCNINITNGTWSKCYRNDDDLTRLIHQVYTEKKPDVDKSPGTELDINVFVQGNLSNNTEEQIITPDGSLAIEQTCNDDSNFEANDENRLRMVTETSGSTGNVEFANELEKANNFEDRDYVQTVENVPNEKMHPRDNILEESDKNVDKNNENDYKSNQENDENITKITSEIIQSYLQRQEHNLSEDLAFCWLWDFAGQKDFYATHQVFLSKCAVFLLVTDSLEFSDIEKLWVDFEKTADYVRFWIDAIHCYWSTGNKGRSDPPVIVVCTNEDKYKLQDPSERKVRQENFKDNLGKILNKQKKKEHLRAIHFVSNTEDDDSVFEDIRTDISRHAMAMNDWGKNCPLKWLMFQQVLRNLKDSNVQISTTKTLFNIAKHDEIGITKYEEFKLCLQYCHDIGTVIFFDEKHLEDHVILDPKWLIDAFRCLVSDKIDKVSDNWQTLKVTGELTESLITLLFSKEPKLGLLENKTHLLEVMKRFDIVVTLRGSKALYMPCAMESCSFENVQKQFMDKNKPFERTSWLCLEFQFLPPAFFNHILAWYIKQYTVSVILERGTERKALYRQIGVFDLDLSGCEQLVVCEGPNVIALQVWNSRMSDQRCEAFGTNLFQFVDTLRNRYRMQIEFTKTFKCKDGDFTINRKKMDELHADEYRCLEHRTNHLSDDLLKPWGFSKELQQSKKKHNELLIRVFHEMHGKLVEKSMRSPTVKEKIDKLNKLRNDRKKRREMQYEGYEDWNSNSDENI